MIDPILFEAEFWEMVETDQLYVRWPSHPHLLYQITICKEPVLDHKWMWMEARPINARRNELAPTYLFSRAELWYQVKNHEVEIVER